MADADVAVAEEFVFDAEKLTALNREVAATREAHRLASRRAVERLGNRRPPVDDHRLTLLVGNGQTPDVETLHPVGTFGVAVDPAKDESCVAEVELRQTIDQRLVEDVAFVARLEGPAETGLGEVTKLPGVGPALLETRIGVVDEGLFLGEIGVRRGHVVSCIRPFLGSVEPTHAAHTLGRDRVMLFATGTIVPATRRRHDDEMRSQ